MKHTLNVLLVTLVTSISSSIYWLTGGSPYVMEDFYKPFVYRQLVPLLAQGLHLFGVRLDLSLVIVVTLSGIGLYLVLSRLLAYQGVKFYEIKALLVVCVACVLLADYRKPYDLMTALLWTGIILFTLQDKKVYMGMLFVLACLNRYDTVLFLLLLIIILTRNFKLVGILGVVWTGITLSLYFIYRDSPGTFAWVEPMENIVKFIENPLMLMFHLSIVAGIVFLTVKNWNNKPRELKLGTLILTLLFLVLYVVFGQAFEIRVFWELVPLISLMIF